MRSTRPFGLTDSGTRGSPDSSTDGTADDGTGNGTRSGLLFDGGAAGGGTDGYGGKSKGQDKAFHRYPPAIWSSRNAMPRYEFRRDPTARRARSIHKFATSVETTDARSE